MAKFVEIPRAPREIEAVQFVTVDNGVPKINENAVPDWFLAAFAQGTLRLVGDDVYLREELVLSGDWLAHEASSGSLAVYSEADFAANYRRKRKIQAARKPRDLKAAA